MGTETILDNADDLELTIPTSGTENWATQAKNGAWAKISQHAHTGSGDGQLIAQSALSKNNGWRPNVTSITAASSAATVDWNNGVHQKVNLNDEASVAMTLNNPVAGAKYSIIFTQGGSTPSAVTWPAAVLWAGGTAPTITASTGAVDRVELYYDGTNYFGSYEQNYS